jgi:hypothetical protein
MSQQQKIHVKLQYNNEFRRFIIEPVFKINDLKQKISELLHLTTPFSIRYLDEESEWITIDSDVELNTGIELSPALLRLRIEQTSTPINPPQDLPNPVVEGERKEKRCKGKWKKQCEKKGENNEEVSDEEAKKWRDARRECKQKMRAEWKQKKMIENIEEGPKIPEGSSEEKRDWKADFINGSKCGRGRRGGRVGMTHNPHKRFAPSFGESDSDSNEDKPVEEMKNEIKSLKQEIVLLAEKKKSVWAEVSELKTQVKALRQNGGAKEDIVKLREQITEKKKVTHEYLAQITNSKNRIWKLKRSLEIKVDN